MKSGLPLTAELYANRLPASGLLLNSSSVIPILAVVINKVFRSDPPKVQLVTLGTGNSITVSSLPFGSNLATHEPLQRQLHKKPSESTVDPSGYPLSNLTNSLLLRILLSL